MVPRIGSLRAVIAAALSVQIITAAFVAADVSAQPQQPQYGEGPGVITQGLPTVTKSEAPQPLNDVSLPSYGEGPGVVGSKLPNTGDPFRDAGLNWGALILVVGIATGLFAVLWSRGRKIASRTEVRRVMIVTPDPAPRL